VARARDADLGQPRLGQLVARLAGMQLEQVKQDLMVSLIDRARARARCGFFCSNHDSGTALPPLRVVAFGVEAP
jgi:hypothetical protein